MKIGTRLTLLAVASVLVVLGIYASVIVHQRRVQAERAVQHEVGLIGSALQVTFEAALQDGLFEDTQVLLKRWQEVERDMKLSFIDLAHPRGSQGLLGFTVAAGETSDGGTTSSDLGAKDAAAEPVIAEPETVMVMPPPVDPGRMLRLTRMQEGDDAVSETRWRDSLPVYVLSVPIHDRDRNIVGALELERPVSDVEAMLSDLRRDTVLAIGGLSVLLALLVWLSARSIITGPMNRLVDAVADVTQGDLGRVILRERNDEVGALAARFNEMTGSLREARAEIVSGVDARAQLEGRLRHSDKLATIGQLAAGIAHEVGTPLNVIGGRARAMRKKASDPAEVVKNASIIFAQTERITKIIEQLLDYARRPVSGRVAVDLHAVAASCVEFLEHQLEVSRVTAAIRAFENELGAATAPTVLGNSDQLQQVCLNLCLNAIQAMPQGGALEISLRGLTRRRPGLDAAAPGQYVQLAVADSGVGIPPEDRERIFEPFFSTKSPGSGAPDSAAGGAGLGLSVSAGIVRDHEGFIEIADREGGGTVFNVYLPASGSKS